MRRLHAIVLLGWHFLLHVLSKLLLVYEPGGLKQFRENFEAEGLHSLDEDERELIADWQRCIGCGLCEAACSELSVVPDHRHEVPSYVAMATMRDLSATEDAVPSAEALASIDDCDELEGICPVDIPLCDLAEFLERLGERKARP
jgi:ferredoxin